MPVADEKIIILGAAGFVGTNLTIKLLERKADLTLVGTNKNHFEIFNDVAIIETKFNVDTDYIKLLKGYDVLYHLMSSTQPTTANRSISNELVDNVIVTTKILDACVEVGIKKVVFISSGGTVYGKDVVCPITEDSQTNPISSYGLQKLTIEKLLYLYNYIYGLDYRVLRLSNPYGPYQRPDGKLGAVTTFIYRILFDKIITIYGDGTVTRDYIYIDDAITAILNAVEGNEKLLNIGSGNGTSLNKIVEKIEMVLHKKGTVVYQKSRSVDVPINYLDISRYEKSYGSLVKTSLDVGIKKTADFLRARYM